MAGATTPDRHGLKPSLTLPMAFCLSLKQVIGGGVIVLTGTAIGLAGAGAAPAYLLACIVVLLVSLPYAVLGAARPMSGSLYRWPSRFIGAPAGFIAFWMVLSTHVGLAAYAVTFGTTLHMLVPFVSARVGGLAALGSVLALNLLGTGVSARAGIVITAAVVLSLLWLAVAGAPHVEPARLADLLPHGWHGLLSAAALLTFPISGATLVSELSGEMRRPGRDIPVAILGATVCAALLYVSVTLVAAGVPSPGAGGRSLTAVAASVMRPLPLALFELGAGIVSMLGIMNAHMLWGSRSILMAAQDGWLPHAFGKTTTKGVPVWPLLLLGAIGAVPLLAGLDVASIIRVSGLGASISAILSIACAPLNAQSDPTAYRASPLALPIGMLLLASVLAIASQGVTIVLLLRDLNLRLILWWGLWLTAGGVIIAIRLKHVRVAED
jgi:APA family basic amino acid/polyamine antiporter